MADLYGGFPDLTFDRPSDGVLRITLDGPGLNAVDPASTASSPTCGSRSTAIPTRGWRCLQGAGKGVLGRRQLRAARRASSNDYARAHCGCMREARDLVFNVINCSKPIVSAIHGPAVGAGLVAGLLADVSVVGRTARIIDGHTRLGVAAGDHAAICWPLLCGMAKAKYYLLTCDTLTGEEAERIGLVSLCVDDDQVQDRALEVADAARRRRAVAPSAGRSTRSTTGTARSRPIFDASLAYEFYGFGGPDAREGLASHTEKRAPHFDGPTSE